jgi:hypothetical protein
MKDKMYLLYIFPFFSVGLLIPLYFFRDKLKEKFLPPLLQLISHINHSFGRFYASMNCVGEVCLHTGEGENDV